MQMDKESFVPQSRISRGSIAHQSFTLRSIKPEIISPPSAAARSCSYINLSFCWQKQLWGQTGLGSLLLPAVVGPFSTWIKSLVQFPAQPTQTHAGTRELAETGQAIPYTWIINW